MRRGMLPLEIYDPIGLIDSVQDAQRALYQKSVHLHSH